MVSYLSIEQVTETADFQKDLNLDSLDRVELVMVFEEEISIEIPEEKADKLTCCADIAKYMAEEKLLKSKVVSNFKYIQEMLPL